MGKHVKELVIDTHVDLKEGKITTIFPEGMNLEDINVPFDRGQKVVFGIDEHPEWGVWMSKDPYCSHVFPADEVSQNLREFPNLWGDTWILARPYTVETLVD